MDRRSRGCQQDNSRRLKVARLSKQLHSIVFTKYHEQDISDRCTYTYVILLMILIVQHGRDKILVVATSIIRSSISIFAPHVYIVLHRL